MRKQLPLVDVSAADIVIVADDNLGGLSLEEYRATLEALAAALPADRTVISDLTALPGEARYQPVLTEVTDAHGILRADFEVPAAQQQACAVSLRRTHRKRAEQQPQDSSRHVQAEEHGSKRAPTLQLWIGGPATVHLF